MGASVHVHLASGRIVLVVLVVYRALHSLWAALTHFPSHGRKGTALYMGRVIYCFSVA